jgi:hypothetical protein
VELNWQEDGVIKLKKYLKILQQYFSLKEIFGEEQLLLVEAQMIQIDIKILGHLKDLILNLLIMVV